MREITYKDNKNFLNNLELSEFTVFKLTLSENVLFWKIYPDIYINFL